MDPLKGRSWRFALLSRFRLAEELRYGLVPQAERKVVLVVEARSLRGDLGGLLRGGGGGTAIMLASYTAPDSLLLLLISVPCCLSALCISRALAVLTPFLRNRSPASTSWARGDCVCLHD